MEKWGLCGVTLRSYQLHGVSWLAECYDRNHGCILGDEMGLGKTVQSISLLLYLSSCKGKTGPFLVLCPLSVVNNWQSEMTRFAPGLKILSYCGSKEEREKLRENITTHVAHQSGNWSTAKYTFQVMLAHYEVVIRDNSFLQKIPWQCLIVDEGHRLKNSSSVLYRQLQELHIPFSLLLTGTPVQNNLTELYSLLSFVAAKEFPNSNSEEFLKKFSNINDSAVASNLHSTVEPFILRRVKSEVVLDLPVKSEVVLYTGLSAMQKKYYKAILTKDLSAFGEAGSKTRLMNILTQLRKCVNHPYLFDGAEPEPFQLGEHLVDTSGKLYVIDKLLAHLKQRGHRVLVFSQMTRMLDIIQDYLGYRGYSYERLDGSVRGEERFLAVRNFSENDQTFVFLLSTRAGGQGLNLVGADTVIFVDSDFNPQNDLQAAARAHRIGQTRPVKIIRLVTKDSVEEIVLKRATAKLKLTSTVIEGGKFTHGTVATVGDNATQLSDILKFGLDTLLQSDESSIIVDEDLKNILGDSEGGEWISEVVKETRELIENEEAAPDTMYMYEGKDYSKSSEPDRKTFDQLLADQLKLCEGGVGERALRSNEVNSSERATAVMSLPETRKRRQLTEHELEARRNKRAETMAKKIKLREEQERKRLEEKQRKRDEIWQRNDYTSYNIPVDSSSDEDEIESEGERAEEGGEGEVENQINYVVGDVTQPQNTGNADAIIVHCVDDSGRWGKGGLFSALSARSPQPQTQYELAGRMKDLHLGDAHVISVDDVLSRHEGNDMVALIVAQCRERGGGRLSGIKLSALNTGLQRVARLAQKKKASVHLPRIGHSTPQFNWYGTERLIRKHLASAGIPTYIYYFTRHTHKQKATSQSLSPTSLHPSPSSSHQGPSLLPLDPLPDIFTGVVAYLYGYEGEEKQRRERERYLIAYDGVITNDINDNTTHIIVRSGVKPPSDVRFKEGVVVVTEQWFHDSLKEGKLIPNDNYLL